MAQQWYRLAQIPDLALVKYASLEESGPSGVLKQFSPLLKTLHRVGLIYQLRLHLIHRYQPERGGSGPTGINYYLGFSGHDDQLAQAPIDALLQASPLCDYFVLSPCSDDHPAIVGDQPWQGVQVVKQEYFYEAIPHPNLPDSYHQIALWEGEASSRLLGFNRLLEGLQQPACFSLTLEAVELSDEIRAIFSKTLKYLREFNGGMMRALLSNEFKSRPRDPNAEEALKSYEAWIKCADEQALYRGALRFFSSSEYHARLLADMTMSEVLSSGGYKLAPLPEGEPLLPAADRPMPTPHDSRTPSPRRHMLPTVFAHDEIEPLFRLPVLYEGEQLSLPKETDPQLGDADYRLGILKDRRQQPLTLPLANLTKHALVVGVPGSGKTNTLMQMAFRTWKYEQVPFLILEPAKREYRGLLNLDPQIALFTPGRNSAVAEGIDPFRLHINPFEFPLGYPLEEHINNLIAVFEGSFPLFPPLPSLVEQALEQVYLQFGWQSEQVNTGDNDYPMMQHFVAALRQMVEEAEYEGEIKGNLKAALSMRFERLTRRGLGRVFNVPFSTFKPEEWLQHPVVIELESLGSANANFLTLLLLTLIRETLSLKPNKQLRHLLFLEEAHNLIGPESYTSGGDSANPKAAATAYIVRLLAEVRALGQGIVIADQLPTVLAPEVVKNTSTKICHRLTAPDDRKVMGQAMLATEQQLEQVAMQRPGEALIYFEGLLKPFLAHIDLADDEERHLTLPDDASLRAMLLAQPLGLPLLFKAHLARARDFIGYQKLDWDRLQKDNISPIRSSKDAVLMAKSMEDFLKLKFDLYKVDSPAINLAWLHGYVQEILTHINYHQMTLNTLLSDDFTTQQIQEIEALLKDCDGVYENFALLKQGINLWGSEVYQLGQRLENSAL